MKDLARDVHPSHQLWALVAFLSLTLAASRCAEVRRPHYLRLPLATISKEIAGWQLVDEQSLDNRTQARLAPTNYISRIYGKSGKQLDLFVAHYAEQRAGEATHSPKYCLPGGGWEIWKRDSVEVPFQSRKITINRYSIQRMGDRATIFYWYQGRQRIVANEYAAKFMLVQSALMSGDTGAALVRIVVDDEPETLKSGALFAVEVMAELQRCFGS